MHFNFISSRIGKALAKFSGPACGALFSAGFFLGCQPAHTQEPLPAHWSDNDPHARTEFWSFLPNRAVVGNDEVFHALLLYLDSADASADYDGRVAALKSRKMLPADFAGKANDVCDRGTLAVALVHVLKIEGGVNMHLFGDLPRYAVRALEYRGVYPPSSPNQAISGGQFVGIMQKAEEYEHGNPADAPAVKLPTEVLHPGGALAAADAARIAPANTPQPADASEIFTIIPPELFSVSLAPVPSSVPYFIDLDQPAAFRPLTAGDLAASQDNTDFGFERPFYLADAATAPAVSTEHGAKKLNVIVTGVEGDSAELRKSEGDPWIRARVGMVVHNSAEFRTGAKSAIRFIIPPDQTFCLDSQGSTKVLDAVADGNKVKTDIGLSRGRVRYDVDKNAARIEPIRIEQAGIEHDATIRSPNSALALRGTKVSLFDQPGYDPEAISLTGAAVYVNTRGQRIAFGGNRRAAISGAQTSAAQGASERSAAIQSADLAQLDFQNRETSIVIQRGGFVRGDVVVGSLHLSDFHNKLPGSLDFVLQWTGQPGYPLVDLNLGVFSPNFSKSNPDFVANPPYSVSLNPNNPANEKLRASNYPEKSSSGGSISKNSIGPAGLELASWPANYPAGAYKVIVYDYFDVQPPPAKIVNPVTYTIDVFLNGKQLTQTSMETIGYLQTSTPLTVNVPASTGTSSVKSPTKKPVPAVVGPTPTVPAKPTVSNKPARAVR